MGRLGWPDQAGATAGVHVLVPRSLVPGVCHASAVELTTPDPALLGARAAPSCARAATPSYRQGEWRPSRSRSQASTAQKRREDTDSHSGQSGLASGQAIQAFPPRPSFEIAGLHLALLRRWTDASTRFASELHALSDDCYNTGQNRATRGGRRVAMRAYGGRPEHASLAAWPVNLINALELLPLIESRSDCDGLARLAGRWTSDKVAGDERGTVMPLAWRRSDGALQLTIAQVEFKIVCGGRADMVSRNK